MSRLDSDMDARDWADGPHTVVQRTCADCEDVVLVSADEPYRLTMLCDKCYRVALASVIHSVITGERTCDVVALSIGNHTALLDTSG